MINIHGSCEMDLITEENHFGPFKRKACLAIFGFSFRLLDRPLIRPVIT
jgi:hypothetical protein